jgi:predicted Zn-dependent protease
MAPKDFLGWLEKGVALSAIGRYSEAIPLLQKSVDIEPKATRAWDELAFALEKSGDIVGAKNARTKAESYRQILSKQ